MEIYQLLLKEMKGEFDGKGGGKWPLWVSQVICVLLVNGIPPSAMPSHFVWNTVQC